MRRCLLATMAATMTIASPTAAQMPNLAEVGAQYLPPVRARPDEPLDAQITSYDVALNVPLPLGETTFLIPGASYHVDSVSYAGGSPEFIDLRGFHGVDLPILFVQLLPQDWSLSLRFSAGLAGDFQAVDGSMVRINAMAMASHTFSESFSLGGGALASYAFGSLLPLPVVFVDYRPHPRWSVTAFVPAFVQSTVTVGDRLELGYRVDVQGNAYAIRDERIAERWPCVSSAEGAAAEPHACLDHVAYSLVSAGPTVNVRLFATVWLETFVGHSVYRRFDLMNAEDEPVPGGREELPRSWLVRGGLTWRIAM